MSKKYDIIGTIEHFIETHQGLKDLMHYITIPKNISVGSDNRYNIFVKDESALPYGNIFSTKTSNYNDLHYKICNSKPIINIMNKTGRLPEVMGVSVNPSTGSKDYKTSQILQFFIDIDGQHKTKTILKKLKELNLPSYLLQEKRKGKKVNQHILIHVQLPTPLSGKDQERAELLEEIAHDTQEFKDLNRKLKGYIRMEKGTYKEVILPIVTFLNEFFYFYFEGDKVVRNRNGNGLIFLYKDYGNQIYSTVKKKGMTIYPDFRDLFSSITMYLYTHPIEFRNFYEYMRKIAKHVNNIQDPKFGALAVLGSLINIYSQTYMLYSEPTEEFLMRLGKTMKSGGNIGGFASELAQISKRLEKANIPFSRIAVLIMAFFRSPNKFLKNVFLSHGEISLYTDYVGHLGDWSTYIDKSIGIKRPETKPNYGLLHTSDFRNNDKFFKLIIADLVEGQSYREGFRDTIIFTVASVAKRYGYSKQQVLEFVDFVTDYYNDEEKSSRIAAVNYIYNHDSGKAYSLRKLISVIKEASPIDDFYPTLDYLTNPLVVESKPKSKEDYSNVLKENFISLRDHTISETLISRIKHKKDIIKFKQDFLYYNILSRLSRHTSVTIYDKYELRSFVYSIDFPNAPEVYRGNRFLSTSDTTNRLINALVKKGYVTSERLNENTKRIFPLRLAITEEGLNFFNKAKDIRISYDYDSKESFLYGVLLLPEMNNNNDVDELRFRAEKIMHHLIDHTINGLSRQYKMYLYNYSIMIEEMTRNFTQPTPQKGGDTPQQILTAKDLISEAVQHVLTVHFATTNNSPTHNPTTSPNPNKKGKPYYYILSLLQTPNLSRFYNRGHQLNKQDYLRLLKGVANNTDTAILIGILEDFISQENIIIGSDLNLWIRANIEANSRIKKHVPFVSIRNLKSKLFYLLKRRDSASRQSASLLHHASDSRDSSTLASKYNNYNDLLEGLLIITHSLVKEELSRYAMRIHTTDDDYIDNYFDSTVDNVSVSIVESLLKYTLYKNAHFYRFKHDIQYVSYDNLAYADYKLFKADTFASQFILQQMNDISAVANEISPALYVERDNAVLKLRQLYSQSTYMSNTEFRSRAFAIKNEFIRRAYTYTQDNQSDRINSFVNMVVRLTAINSISQVRQIVG